jgi:hypothetical protein
MLCEVNLGHSWTYDSNLPSWKLVVSHSWWYGHLGEEIIRTLLMSQQNNNIDIKYGLCAATSSNSFTNLFYISYYN